jgi:hypothetical protein
MKPVARELSLLIVILVLLSGSYRLSGPTPPSVVAGPPASNPLTQMASGAQLPAVAPTLSAPPLPPEGYRCGVERWPVKTLSDLDALRVNLTPIRSSVMELTSIPRPSGSFSYNRRVAPIELTTYVVKAIVVELRGEEDNDISRNHC